MQPRHQIGGYREFAADPSAPFVEAFWTHYTPAGPADAHAAHRVLPEIAVSVAFHVIRDDAGRPLAGGPILIGPKLRPQLFTLQPGHELTALRIKAEWVAPILGVDPIDTERMVVDLRGVVPALAERLEPELWRTRDPEAAIRALSRAIVEMRASPASPSPDARTALEALRRTAGRVSCTRLAHHAGASSRHLRRHVRDATGVSPKTYARTLRLVRAMELADGTNRPAWADIALRAGYCDQSHLIRDCIEMTGLSPRTLHVERQRQIVAVAEISNPG